MHGLVDCMAVPPLGGFCRGTGPPRTSRLSIFFRRPSDIESLCGDAYFLPMEKLLLHLPVSVQSQRERRLFGRPNLPFAWEWADAETRAFLERPQCFGFRAKLLRAILLAIMAISLANIAWIVATHA
jgi:hypothetical protein